MDEDATLDARGLRCPLPVVRMEALLRKMPVGAHLKVFADDPVAAVDIPHFARTGGHHCRALPAGEGFCVFLVTRGEKP
jgi:tRNA 2-thiouridine synthesizing protein A